MSAREIGYNAEALRAIVRALLTEKDSNAVTILLALQGRNSQEASDALVEIGREGGEADTIAKKLADKETAHAFCRDLARRFATFAGLFRDVLPRGVWKRNAGSYQLLTFAEASRNLQQRRAEESAKARRMAVTYAKAAKLLHIERDMVKTYVHTGHLSPVHVRGRRLAVGVTRESVETCKLYLDGYRFMSGGAVVEPGAWLSLDDVCNIIGRGKTAASTYADEGRLARVYNRPDAARACCCGYTKASAEALAKELAAGVFFTRAGKIVSTERVTLDEARTITGRGRRFVLMLAKAGKLDHVFADPGFSHPVGYTRASVVAVAQEYPPDVRAMSAVAVPGFMIEELQPTPRPQRLMAAKLSPAEPEAPKRPAATTPTLEPPKRRPSPFVFRLIDTNRKDTQTMENTPKNETKVPKAAAPSADSGKLQIAKAFTIHDGGVIRAICVSEDDRDEIVAALNFWRKCKCRESEIESALAFMDMAKATLGIAATAETKAEPQAGENAATETGAKE